MQTLPERELIMKINDGEIFSARINTGAFLINVDSYVPVICSAIHDGHRVHAEFADKMLVTGDERKYEEDPFTADIIKPLPITLQVLDSRYNYDLNREPKSCIYDDAWGKKVWKRELSEVEQRDILELHASYYRVLHALLNKVEQMFSCCVLYDLHSYNYSRLKGNPPLFNIGTHYIEKKTFLPVLNHLQTMLAAISLPNVENRTVYDEVFVGKGYQAAFMKKNHPESYCVPLEIKKVFMDEQRFQRYPEVFEPLAAGIQKAIRDNAEFFGEHFVRDYTQDSGRI